MNRRYGRLVNCVKKEFLCVSLEVVGCETSGVAAKEVKLEKKLDELVQERNSVAANITRVVEQAVRGAINEAKFQPTRRAQVHDSQMRGREPFTNQTQPALNYIGNSVSNVTPNAVALVTQ